MVSAQYRGSLYVVFPLYFVILGSCAYFAYRRMETMKKKTTTDELSAHYLGGRDFGPLLMAGTLFASLFSGYTVIGVPNEAFTNGWSALRWIPTLLAVVAGYFGTGLRLRRLSILRNHSTGLDFVTDRFQSQFLRYTIFILQVVPSIIYLAVQVNSIKSTFNAIFELSEDSIYPVIIIFALILVFEWIGGLSSVAMTDTIQAAVMIFSFIAMPVIMWKKYGGLGALNSVDYPKPQFFQTMNSAQQLDFWQFSLINFSFFTLPHFMQRTYAAKDLSSLQVGYIVMAISPWIASFVGVLIGIIGVQILGNGAAPTNPFASIMEALMELGGFPAAVAILAVTGSVAAIMSTADSLIIALSQTITAELINPNITVKKSGQLVLYGRVVSFLSVSFALAIGIGWKEGVTDLGKIQFPLSAMAVPTFLFGLFSYDYDVHPWSLAVSANLAVAYIFAIYFGYLRGGNGIAINPGITGFFLQIFLTFLFETVRRFIFKSKLEDACTNATEKEESTKLHFPLRPKWDIPNNSRFGKHSLTPKAIWKSMEGLNEPLANPWWAFVLFLVISNVTPTAPGSQPPLDESTGAFLYLPVIYNGLPWWAVQIILKCFIPTIILLVAILRMPTQYPNIGKKDDVISEFIKVEFGNSESYNEAGIHDQSDDANTTELNEY